MPIHRAYYATAAEARAAAASAVDTLNALWRAATTDAGAEIESTAPVVGVRVDSSDNPFPLVGTTSEAVWMRITAPDGRSEIAKVSMPSEQTDAMLVPAYGTARLTSTAKCTVSFKSRRAKSVAVTMMDATVTVLDGLVLQDVVTGKKFTIAAWTVFAAGANTVPIVEVDATDGADVSFGSMLQFLAPPANAIPLAPVNAMLGLTLGATAQFRDELGRSYRVTANSTISDAAGLSGYLSGSATIARTPVDDAAPLSADLTSLEVGATLEWEGAPTTYSDTITVTAKGEVTVPAGTVLTYVVGATTYRYTTTTDTIIPDVLYTDAVFLAEENGAASDRAIGDVMIVVSPPASVDTTASVVTTVAAAALPQSYASQVVGSALEWTARVYQAPDRRWVAEVSTLPSGS